MYTKFLLFRVSTSIQDLLRGIAGVFWARVIDSSGLRMLRGSTTCHHSWNVNIVGPALGQCPTVVDATHTLYPEDSACREEQRNCPTFYKE